MRATDREPSDPDRDADEPISLPAAGAGFFAILVGLFIAVLMLRIACAYAYVSLGVSPRTAMFLLFASLIGSISTFRSPNCRRSRSCPTR